MTTGLATATATATAAVAVANWATRFPGSPLAGRPWVEWLTKPAATLGLIVLAISMGSADPAQQRWFVAGLVLCLMGDVALMLPTEMFRTGLTSFLLGHVAFIVGFIERGATAPSWSVVVGLVILAGCMLIGVRHLLPSVRTRAPELYGPVVAYIVVIASMTVASIWGQHWAAPLGAATFAVSDLTLADNKFVAARRWSPLAVMVTYHLALALLVLSIRP